MTVAAGVPIIEGVFVSTSLASLFKVGTNDPTAIKRARIDNIAFTNVTGSPVELTVQIIKVNISPGNQFINVDAVTIGAHETFEPSSLLQGMNTGDDVQASAGTASAINCRATGTTYTT